MKNLTFLLCAAAVAGLIYLAVYKIYPWLFYRSKKFLEVKEWFAEYAKEYQELREHIKLLKRKYNMWTATDEGSASLTDHSRYNFQRTYWGSEGTNNVYRCSAAICKKAEERPFWYVCKYFGIPETEESLQTLEDVYEAYSSIEKGKEILDAEWYQLLEKTRESIPELIRRVDREGMMEQLGFKKVSQKRIVFRRYVFDYVSPGGNSHMRTTVELDVNNIERFIRYLAEKVKFRKSVAGQRALMTKSLREKILARDGYRCCQCGASITDEPHLLLEVDHIIPVSKGGITTENNLQTLCWRCNRHKGNRL